MARVYYDQDADLADLAGETVAVLGYGIQGRAQALNLRDSGATVVVGNREDAYRAQAVTDGFEVLPIPEAAARGDLILLLVPDEVQGEVYEQAIRPALAPGKALVFAHGFAVRYGVIRSPEDVDLLLLAPRLPGKYVRDLYLRGSGAPVYVDAATTRPGGPAGGSWPWPRRSGRRGSGRWRSPSPRRPSWTTSRSTSSTP